jgi:hypothetical protein
MWCLSSLLDGLRNWLRLHEAMFLRNNVSIQQLCNAERTNHETGHTGA